MQSSDNNKSARKVEGRIRKPEEATNKQWKFTSPVAGIQEIPVSGNL